MYTLKHYIFRTPTFAEMLDICQHLEESNKSRANKDNEPFTHSIISGLTGIILAESDTYGLWNIYVD